MIPNYNHYDLNPPEPVIIEPQNPLEFEQEMIAEHNFERSYEEDNLKRDMQLEDAYFKELIKNEPKCSI